MISRPLLRLALLAPALAACVIVFLQLPSFPLLDDYHAILSFAADYQKQTGWEQKLLLIATQQHNEYKLVLEHSVVAAELQITRHLNFRFLCFLGDLAWLATAIPLWKTYGRLGLAHMLPISFLFFSLTYWESLNWAMSGLQNIPVIPFSLLAIYLLAPREQLAASRNRLVWACLAAALACFTSANGFLLAPVGLLMLLLDRAYARTLPWCLSFVAPLAAYLYHFAPGKFPAVHDAYISRPFFFLAFLGCVIPVASIAVLLGLVVLVVFILSLRSRFDRTNPVACYFALWIMISAALVAWVRGTQGLYVTSRYSIYSVLLLIYCYAFLTPHLITRSSAVRRAFYGTSLVVSIAVCLTADMYAWQKLAERRRMVVAGMEHYCAAPAVNSPLVDLTLIRLLTNTTEPDDERRELTQAIQTGLMAPVCNQPVPKQ